MIRKILSILDNYTAYSLECGEFDHQQERVFLYLLLSSFCFYIHVCWENIHASAGLGFVLANTEDSSSYMLTW